ncbi:DegV family protein [Saccharospirillum salsuginis]|uniref:EDD domain protein, DegV family n=1 Tax=Saccharospirillum salsuginis TaxID=418750 RepID=A0A918NDV3_9GAMM|nr:DegV family protein [Saccharospirillum salsuginis]GGX59977.1 hypothetical protein GCM10007392_29960 [Saccharospirillum salsuginis]
MYLTLLTDATCDLPSSVITRFEAKVLPTILEPLNRSDGTLWVDDRSHKHTQAVYHRMTESKDKPWRSLGGDTDAFILNLTDHWIYHSDSLQVITPAQAWSPTHQKLRESSFVVQPELDQRREAANLKGHYRVRLLDSGQLYAGYGLVMHETMDLHREHKVSIDKLRKPLDAFRKRVQMLYSCPDPGRLHRLKDPRFETLGWLKQQQLRLGGTPIFSLHDDQHNLIERAPRKQSVDHLLNRILEELEERRITYRVVNVSYAGPLAEVRTRPLFRKLHEVVLHQGGHVWLSTMSATSAVELGRGALSVAFVV